MMGRKLRNGSEEEDEIRESFKARGIITPLLEEYRLSSLVLR